MSKIADFNGSTNNAYITPNIEVYLDGQSIANNTSTVRIRFYLKKNASYADRTYGSFSGYLYINGSRASVSEYVELYGNSWNFIDEYTVVVPHSDDGSKKVSVSATGGIGGTSYTSTTCSRSITLPTIARASTASVPSSAVMGSAVSITIQRASSDFTHDVKWSFGGLSGTLATASSALSLSWTPATATLAPLIPNAVSAAASIEVTTYAGDTVIGTRTSSFTLSVPSSAVPTVGTVTVAEAVSGIAAQFGDLVQSKSRAAVTVAASGVCGSTISAVQSVFDGASYAGTSWTSALLNSAGTVNIKTTVTDSRGRTASKTTAVTVLPYARPQLTAFKAWRVDGSRAEQPGGNYAAVRYAYAAASLNGHNTASMTVKAARADLGVFDTTLLTGSQLSVNTTAYPTTALSSDYRWRIKMTVTDWFGEETTAEILLHTAAVVMDFKADGTGLAIGKVAEYAGLEVSWATDFREAVSMDVPLGLASGGTGASTVAGARDALGLGNTGGALPLANGGTGAEDADAARDNLAALRKPKLLWSGTWSGGSITVSGFSDYALVGVESNDGKIAVCDVSDGTNASNGGYYHINGSLLAWVFSFSISGNTLGSLVCKWIDPYDNSSGNLEIRKIIGFVKKADLQ